jgi:hypothetical protein
MHMVLSFASSISCDCVLRGIVGRAAITVTPPVLHNTAQTDALDSYCVVVETVPNSETTKHHSSTPLVKNDITRILSIRLIYIGEAISLVCIMMIDRIRMKRGHLGTRRDRMYLGRHHMCV